MGYTTNFEGSFVLDTPLSFAQMEFLKEFSGTRRMKRDVNKIKSLPKEQKNHKMLKLLNEVGLGLEYYGGAGHFGQDEDDSIVDYNDWGGFPSLWCQWVPNDEGTAIEWNGAEKFYDYVKWIEYIITNFLKPWGKVLNGEVTWQGEENSDMGKIVIKNNKVTIKKAKVTWE